MLLDATGRPIAVGSTTAGAVIVMRVTADGLLDPTFGQDGVFAEAAGVTLVAGTEYSEARGVIDARQRLIVVGTGTSNGQLGIFAARVWL